jgi:hypothetical protein
MLRPGTKRGLAMVGILRLGSAVLAGMLVGLPAVAAEREAAESAKQDAAEPEIEPEAHALLLRAAELVAGSQRFRFVTEVQYDVRQDSGQLLEFGANRSTTVQRPDSVRVEAENREGDRSLVIFDGEQVTLYDADENVYASAERKANLDDMVKFVRTELETPLPLSEIIDTSFPKVVRERVQSIYSAGEETLRGKRCEHLAVEAEAVDAQFWVALDGQPVFCRIVLTYKHAEGNPQYRSDFVEWDLEPKLSADLFRFEPPKGAERIPFLLPARKAPAAESKTGGSQ